MGQTFSASSCSVKLRAAGLRLVMLQNKSSNACRVEQKVIAQLLQQGKQESARIKTEGLIHARSLQQAMECVQLQCELLQQRIALINSASPQSPPDELEEAMASLIYASTRLAVPELRDVQLQLGAKFGERWAHHHLNNDSKAVNQRLVQRLSMATPSFDDILAYLNDVAAQFSIEWTPDLAELDPVTQRRLGDAVHPSLGGGNQQLGSVAKTSNTALPASAATSVRESSYDKHLMPGSASPPVPTATLGSVPLSPQLRSVAGSPAIGERRFALRYPLTLTCQVLEAHGLGLTCVHMPVQVKLGVAPKPGEQSQEWTSLNSNGVEQGEQPIWTWRQQMQLFPTALYSSGRALSMSVISVTDGSLIGRCLINCDELLSTESAKLYQIFAQNRVTGSVLLSAQFMPCRSSGSAGGSASSSRKSSLTQIQAQQSIAMPNATMSDNRMSHQHASQASQASRGDRESSIASATTGLQQAHNSSPQQGRENERERDDSRHSASVSLQDAQFRSPDITSQGSHKPAQAQAQTQAQAASIKLQLKHCEPATASGSACSSAEGSAPPEYSPGVLASHDDSQANTRRQNSMPNHGGEKFTTPQPQPQPQPQHSHQATALPNKDSVPVPSDQSFAPQSQDESIQGLEARLARLSQA